MKKRNHKGFSIKEILKRSEPAQIETEEYERFFMRPAPVTARSGKTVYICPEHHARITRILHVIGKNDVSLFSYIYNVLEHHFDTYRDGITELYEKNRESIF